MNHKAACSTVLRSIFCSSWEYYTKGPITIFEEDIFQTPGLIEELRRKPFISVVRNPYARALSGYLHKIADQNNPTHGLFVERFFEGRPPPNGISFEQFLTCLAFDHPRRMDSHFRPQYINLQLNHLAYERLFAVEDMERLLTFLLHNGIEPVSEFRHSTGAASGEVRARYYSDRCKALVGAIYANDFCLLGYPLEFERIAEPPAIASQSNIKVANDDMIDFMTGLSCPLIDREHRALHAFNAAADDGRRIEISSKCQGFSDYKILASLSAGIAAVAPQLSRQLAGRIDFLRTRHLSYLR